MSDTMSSTPSITPHTENYFTRLARIDVTPYVEKKGPFSYLSWPFAVSQLRQVDPQATWEVKRFNGLPYLICDLGVFVEVAVTVQGVTLSQIHPVLDGKNRPIQVPSSFDINTSLQRCLVKAIALHGLGLAIYAGEDLPLVEASPEAGTGQPSTPPLEPAPPREGAREGLREVLNESPRPTPKEASPADRVTAAQVNYIRRLMGETGTSLQKVLDFCGVTSLEDLSKPAASRVIRSLEQSRSRPDQREAA